MRINMNWKLAIHVTTVLTMAALAEPSQAAIDSTCVADVSTTSLTGTALDTSTTKSGVEYDSATSVLKLNKESGSFQKTTVGIPDTLTLGCSADFDGDGWVDFVGTGDGADTAL